MTDPAHDAPPAGGRWRQQLRGVVAERLGLKATALVLSLLLWFVVHFVRVVAVAR